MKKNKIVIIIVIIVLAIIAGTVASLVIKDAKEKKERHEIKMAEREKEYNERNARLYDQYNGQWYSKEDDSLYFKLYKDENGCTCVSFTAIDKEGNIYEKNHRNVDLAIGAEDWMNKDNNEYLKVYYNVGDASGWYDFLLFDGDDSRLGYEEIVYYRQE